MDSSIRLVHGASIFSVDSPHLTLLENATPVALLGDLSSRRLNALPISHHTFFEGIPISENTAAVRLYLPTYQRAVLAKLDLGGSASLKAAPFVLEKQVDGIFSTDGHLMYNQELKSLVYVYSYRNQFIRMDTGFKVLYRARTIDTNTVAKVSVVREPDRNIQTLASPPLEVNLVSAINSRYLLIHSGLRADNEPVRAFSSCDVVDVYDLRDGGYSGSLYLMRPAEGKLYSLLFDGQELFAIYGSMVYKYNFPPL